MKNIDEKIFEGNEGKNVQLVLGRDLFIKGFDKKARAFVQIQTGCDHRCTFCIIPYGRGNSRSVPINNVCKQIKILLEKGFKEIVLTGVDLTSYGFGQHKLKK